MIYCVTILGRNDPLEQLDNLNISNKIMNPLSNDGQHSLLSEELRFSDELFEDAKLIMKDLFSAVSIVTVLYTFLYFSKEKFQVRVKNWIVCFFFIH